MASISRSDDGQLDVLPADTAEPNQLAVCPRLDSAVHERNRQSGWVRPADPGIPASGDASGKARAGRDSRYHIGQSLRHARFGEGVVTGIEGNGDDARIQIRFKAPHGVKWLALAVAKLEPV